MAFYRRRPRPDAEKCAVPAKARASALETLAGQEVSANMSGCAAAIPNRPLPPLWRRWCSWTM